MTIPDDKKNRPESCRIALPGQGEGEGLPKPAKVDRFDLVAVAVVLALLLAAISVMVFQPADPERRDGTPSAGRRNVVVIDPDLDRKLALAADLLNSGDPVRVTGLLDSLVADFPYEGGPHLLKGDLFLRLQQPVEAMLEYRRAVDLNPDYLDKKMTEVFQGKKIKNTLEEARAAIDAGLAQNPGDGDLRRQREILYYMLRKVAGSCG